MYKEITRKKTKRTREKIKLINECCNVNLFVRKLN